MRKSQAEINEWISQQEARLGINQANLKYSNALTDGALGIPTNCGDSPTLGNVAGDDATLQHVATVTVMLPSMAAVTRVAHAAADAKIAADPRYAVMCERLDAELAEILEGSVGLAAPRVRRSQRVGSVPTHRVMTND